MALDAQRQLKLKRLLTKYATAHERFAMLYEIGIPERVIFQHNMEGVPNNITVDISIHMCKEADLQKLIEDYIDKAELPAYIKT